MNKTLLAVIFTTSVLMLGCKEEVTDNTSAQANTNPDSEQNQPLDKEYTSLVDNIVKKDLALNTDEEKVSYGVGMDVGRYLKAQNGAAETQLIVGLLDAIRGKEPRITFEQVKQSLENIRKNKVEQSQIALAKETDWLQENKTKDGIITTDSGLQYQIIKEDTNTPTPTAEDVVQIKYKGTLIDGEEFDSSDSATFPVNALIPGFTEALQLMHVGGEYKIFIPPEIAYGVGADLAAELGNRALIFDVTLLDIVTSNQAESTELQQEEEQDTSEQ